MASVFNDQVGLVDLLEFHRQIEGMVAAGVTFSWQGEDSANMLKTELERVAGRAAILVGEGRSFLDAWKSIPDLSPTYKAAFLAWVLSDRSPDAFDLLKPDESKLPQSRWTWFLNFQLGLVFVLALVVLALWLSAGRMSLIYENSKLEVGPLSRFLGAMQENPTFALAGGALALLLWGCVLYSVKRKLGTLNQSITAKEAEARWNWIQARFLKLATGPSLSVVQAQQLFKSVVRSGAVPATSRIDAGELVTSEQAAKQTEDSGSTDQSHSWIAPGSYIRWSAERAMERRLAYRVSALPYTLYFVGSGVVVFGIGLLVFGPLIELLYATVVPEAF
ncbi:hypothetical protein SH449x_001937 [Pirellulaceae bacterium SH449]